MPLASSVVGQVMARFRKIYSLLILWMLFFLTFRHILAAVHLNFNLRREDKCKESDGTEWVRVSYPKFKNGEATVCSVKINPNFGKCVLSKSCRIFFLDSPRLFSSFKFMTVLYCVCFACVCWGAQLNAKRNKSK